MPLSPPRRCELDNDSARRLHRGFITQSFEAHVVFAKDAVALSTMLTSRDRDAAADLLTEAFFDNPAHAFIFPDPAHRRSGCDG